MTGKLGVPAAAFHSSFNCLWCGRPHRTRSDQDLEGWAMLCPDCVGRAQDNEFLRFRLRDGLKRRAAATSQQAPESGELGVGEEAAGATRETDETDPDEADRDQTDETLRRYYAARAPEYDNWYLRRGRYSHGVIADAAWNAELDAATQWLDALPISGEIVELAAGTGWWSPLLASKGQLSLYDAVEEPLDRARDRLLAHGLAAHIHVRDAWAPPDRQVDALFCGFWLSHVERKRLNEFLGICRAWVKPGGLFCFIDSRRDPESSATNHPTPANDQSLRRLDDGREFTITKVYYEPAELEEALRSAGFAEAKVETTPRFFLLGRATAAA
jgi:demethylmenaquinone methyltransferase/2-methoxy-6-polyprenyl-1,4-benzoquinol methylase